jgi:hypothetical protein
MGIHRSFPTSEIQVVLNEIKDIVEALRSNISIENDQWN